MTHLLTGISALDTMIFGDPYDSCVVPRAPGTDAEDDEGGRGSAAPGRDAAAPRPRGFAPGEVVLIRGEPGAGKTTLALQIASNVMRKGVNVLFITVEEPKERLERRVPKTGGVVSWIERHQVVRLVRPRREPASSSAPASGAKGAADVTTEALVRVLPALASISTIATLGIETALERMFKAVRLLRSWAKEREDKRFLASVTEPYLKPDLLIIDSLNAFMNLLLTLYPQTDPRLLLGRICERLRRDVGGNTSRPVIILTGEYHFGDKELERHLPESFFCDTEIVLRTEPLRAARHQVHGDRVTLGYELAALVEHRAKSVESRSFCRVLKCRGAPNQVRRCAYDIGDGGLRFYETYPGDGKLLLFAENEQQRERWQSFFQRDLTDAYPALRYELFTMKTLQSVYESTRRLGHVPLRTDMYLASLDSYWVTGYRDYRLKRYLNDKLHELMEAHGIEAPTLLPRKRPGRTIPTEDELRARQARALCYPEFLNDLLRCCLVKLEHHLYASTVEALQHQFLPKEHQGSPLPMKRVDTLQQKAEHARGEARTQLASLQQNYDGFCRELFGKDVAELIQGFQPALLLRQTFLRPLPRSELELYGQYNGALLQSLRREDMHVYVSGEDHWMSVPYDANIGVFVLRKDLLDRAQLAEDELKSALTSLKRREIEVWEALAARLARGDFDRILEAVEPSGAVPAAVEQELARARSAAEDENASRHAKEMIERARALSAAPTEVANRLDWDTTLCLSAVTGYSLGIETRTFDTLMAFFLELVWNCGGRLNVDAGYRIRNKEELLVPLVQALHYFTAIFDLTETPRNQTVDPSLFAADEARAHDARAHDARAYGEWLFARFWYSTLVDAVKARTGSRRGTFVWQNPKDGCATLEIVPMPKGPQNHGHFACWGEWSFALLAGSENVELACDLISNLMGALKVSDRGLRGAALPTVGHFYKQFGEQRCVPGDLRPDFELPRMTFQQLRAQYLEPKRESGPIPPEEQIFRQYIFDYRHCARVIYAALLPLKDPATRPSTDEQADEHTAEAIVSAALGILSGIEKLRQTYVFIGDSFRNDVIQTQQYRRTEREYPRRPPSTSAPAMLHSKAGQFGARILDISRGGCRVRLDTNGGATPSNVEALELDGTKRVNVEPRWKRTVGTELELGFEFAETLDRATWYAFVST